MTIDAATLTAHLKGTLGELLGIRFVEASPERVVAELPFRDPLTTVGGALHGGALMALADTVGAAATVVNLPAGAGMAFGCAGALGGSAAVCAGVADGAAAVWTGAAV